MKATIISLLVAMLLVGCVRDRITDYYDNGQKKYERTWKGQELDGSCYLVVRERADSIISTINYKDGEEGWAFYCVE